MSIVFTRTIRVPDANGTLTDADSTPTVGIVRTDTSATVVAAGTAMTHDSTGRYSYTLSGETTGVTYRATYSITINGQAVSSASEKTAGNSPTWQQIADQWKTVMLAIAQSGAASVEIDGEKVTYADAESKWQFADRQAKNESGARPRARTVRLDGF